MFCKFITASFLVAGLCAQYRLPSTVKPFFYSLDIHPELEKEKFSGKVAIHVKVESLMDSIILHSRNLTLKDVFLNQEKVSFKTNDKYELVEISRDNYSIPPGNHIIHVKFNGSLVNKDQLGFFKANYTNSDKKLLSVMAVTEFQPTSARRAFPCFDEPSFKSKFQLNVFVENENFTAVSNMEVSKTIKTSRGIVYRFQTTPIMSSYLLAFAVTEMEKKSTEIRVGNKTVSLGLYSVSSTQKNLENAARCIEETLNFYKNYTEFEDPLNKFDFIEYDRSNASIATENWGFISARKGVFRNADVQYDMGQTTEILVHEISHSWFGNLVTIEWWDDLWLQEGLVTFLTTKIKEKLINGYDAIHRFPDDYMYGTLVDEVQNSNLPIIAYLDYSEDIKKLFGIVIYDKGASLFRWLETLLGEETFRNILKTIVKKFAYKTITTNDFIETLEANTKNTNFRDFLESFLYQNKNPVITVTEDDDNYVLKQFSYKKNENALFEYKWSLPITYITSASPTKPSLIWFDKNMEQVIIPKSNGETWIKLNHQGVGFYLVNYSESLWERFRKVYKEMDDFSRKLLTNEAINLYKTGLDSCGPILGLVEEMDCAYETRSFIYSIGFNLMQDGFHFDEEAFAILSNFFGMFDLDLRKCPKNPKVFSIQTEAKKCALWVKTKFQAYKNTSVVRCPKPKRYYEFVAQNYTYLVENKQ